METVQVNITFEELEDLEIAVARMIGAPWKAVGRYVEGNPHDVGETERGADARAIALLRNQAPKLLEIAYRSLDPGFDDIVRILTQWITHYPPNTVVCSDRPDADPGARFAHAIRKALLELEGSRNEK